MDIVERLRKLKVMDEVGSDNQLGREAADEIERLRAELDGLSATKALMDRVGPPDHPDDERHWIGAYLTAAQELDALRADAERYRWLRAQDDWRYRTYPGSMASSRWTSGNSPDEIDAAIDAALGKENKNGL